MLGTLAPIPEKKTKLLQTHGDTRNDPWYWLRNWENPQVKEHLQAENSYTNDVLKDTEELQEQLFEELKKKINEEERSVPLKDGSYWYYSEIKKSQQYSVFKRSLSENLNSPETILDLNEIAQSKPYCELGCCINSPDHKYLAYSIDENGEEEFTIYIKDLETGKLLPDMITGATDCFEWTNDSKGFYYCKLDKNHRPKWVYSHALGQTNKLNALIYEEKDSKFFVSLDKSESSRFIYICAEGNNTSEWHYLPAASLNNEITVVESRKQDHEYDVSDHENNFIIRTNLDALDYRIIKTPIEESNSKFWQDLIPHKYGSLLECYSVYKDYMVVQDKQKGQPGILIHYFKSGKNEVLKFDHAVFDVSIQGHRDYDCSILRYCFQTLTNPPCTYDYDMEKKTRTLKKKSHIPDEKFNEENYIAERIFATSKDGIKIPVSIVMHKDTLDKPVKPLILYGYGAYGVSLETDFNANYLPLLDRGFTLALPHIRGGMDLGQEWYLNGKMLKKKNTFDDYLSVAEHLVVNDYTQKGKIIGCGGSAGGLLMGVAANTNPGLFAGIIAQVPFVDVLTTMLDESLPLTTSEYNEWGNPNNKEYYEYIKSYSPYDNVCKQDYPAMLVTAGIADTRVTYWEPAKWVAKLREHNTGSKPILLHMNFDSGHGGASGRYDYLKEVAMELAFAILSLKY
ncbi:MAG: S9 family peptidase [Oligoflexales bacterium]